MSTDIPRPVLLNNPGDLEKGPAWLGLSVDQPDQRFAKFVTPAHGFRALCRVLLTYQDKHDLSTVREFVNRWAPPNENDTEAYIHLVANYLGVDPDAPLDMRDQTTLGKFAYAISTEEAGHKPDHSPWFTQDQADVGARMALT